MKIYHFAPGTNEFTHESDARPDPLDKGKFLIPRRASSVPPPAVNADEAAVFDGESWAVVPDHRGKTFYDAAGGKVSLDLGAEPGPELAEEIPAAIMLDLTKRERIAEVLTTFGESMFAPVTVGGAWYNGGIQAVTYLLAAQAVADRAGASSVTFTDINDEAQVLTMAEADAVIAAVGQAYETNFLEVQSRKAAIKKAADVDAVGAISTTLL